MELTQGQASPTMLSEPVRCGAPGGRAMRTISRRTLMQMMGAGAVALGTPFGKISKAFAGREKEMNILCWEGYNSAQVLDPFRKKEGATVKAKSLNNDPP